MSWFDTSGIANLAKSALKEAQKTIDKALDIKEDEGRSATAAAKDDEANFFATWGINSATTEGGGGGDDDDDDTIGESSSGVSKDREVGIWGSFTGSFFENPKTDSVTARTVERSESLEERTVLPRIPEVGRLVPSASLQESLTTTTSSSDPFAGSATIDPKTEKSLDAARNYARTNTAASESSLAAKAEVTRDIDAEKRRRYSAGVLDGGEETSSDDGRVTIGEKRDFARAAATATAAANPDRTSVISVCSESSDKRSSESIEILGSRSGSNTDCTKSPDSDVTSASIVSASVTPLGGTKRNSESIEVLPDSLVTSPSSVEILESPFVSPVDQREFPLESPLDDDDAAAAAAAGGAWSSDVSPYVSPEEEDSSKTPKIDDDAAAKVATAGGGGGSSSSSSDASPESVEIIPESEEVSQAEDSYTSASTSTIMTIRELANLKQQTADAVGKGRLEFAAAADKRMHVSCPDSGGRIPAANLNSSLDSLKEKHNLHLPLDVAITRQPLGKGEFDVERMMKRIVGDGDGDDEAASDQVKDSTIEPAADEENPISEQTRNSSSSQPEPADCPEQYLMLTDSSCEGTLIESSSEDNVTVVKSNEPAKVSETPLTASSYVKNMLADAMVEKATDHRVEVLPRENSPISSESRSDLVKIGSDQTSGHTSGDELETTTSSDIEIISRYSPNGDSSSTQSRQSPANVHSSKGTDLLTRTLKSRGHSRELSEISVGSDEVNFEIEKLLKRIQEMTEILEVRESKLIDVSRINMELHEQNINMKKELETIELRAGQSQDVNRITEEYTERLSALEKKFQQAIGERDSLREQLEQLKHEAATRLSSRETMTITAEKDEIISELRAEGEKLSKQQLQHSNIIKKLRAKEKENEALLKSQKEQLEEQSSELERLKRSLYAKEEVERSQIEAVHTLTARNKKQETEILSLQEKLDNALHKMEAYKTSFDAAKTDLTDTKEKLATAEEELNRALENAGESCQLAAQVEDLKLKLRKSEEAHVKSVENLKRTNNELLKRFEAAEARSEELSESVTLATKPLLRQLEQLQASFVVKTNNFAKQEKLMSESIDELQAKLESLVATDRSLVEENLSLRTRVSSLEAQIKRKETERIHIGEELEKLRAEYAKLEETNSRQEKKVQSLEQANAEQVKELKREIQSLTDKLSVERAATDAEKRKNNAILEQQQSIDEESRLSPTLSIGRDSIGSTSSVWPAFNESLFESGSGRFPSVYDSLRATGNSTSMIENLQAQVKQRDGEIQQLQWEISRRNNERDALNIELSTLTLKIEELSGKVTEYETLNESLNEVQTRYDALLQMYGEKVEETEELRLDLEDVKEMYKSQIDQLLKRDAHY